MGVTRKQSTPNFPINEHFLPPDTHKFTWAGGGGGVKNERFS